MNFLDFVALTNWSPNPAPFWPDSMEWSKPIVSQYSRAINAQAQFSRTVLGDNRYAPA